MKENGVIGDQYIIKLKTSGDIISDKFGTIAKGNKISGAEHLFIKVDNIVFDNMNTKGIDSNLFMNDLGLDSAPKEFFEIIKLE